MMLRAMEQHFPGTTHWAWVNLCLSRMGSRNLQELPAALKLFRDKFSTVLIHYRTKQLVWNLPEYFAFGRCGMCSGFYTGSTYHMARFCQLMLEAAEDCINRGFGHADEQHFFQVYWKEPELFEWYVGDYQQMVTNYCAVKEKPESGLRWVIDTAVRDQNWPVVRRACELTWPTYTQMTRERQVQFLWSYYRACHHSYDRERTVVEHLKRLTVLPKQESKIKQKASSEELCCTLLVVNRLLRAHKLPHFYLMGTLLGLVRDGRCIEGDDDVDVALPTSAYTECKKVFVAAGYAIHEDFAGVFLHVAKDISVGFYFYQSQADALVFPWHFSAPIRDPSKWMHVPLKLVQPTKDFQALETVFSTPRQPGQFLEFLYGTHWSRPTSKRNYSITLVNHKPVTRYF